MNRKYTVFLLKTRAAALAILLTGSLCFFGGCAPFGDRRETGGQNAGYTAVDTGAAGLSDSGTGDDNAAVPIDVYVLAGQSNMAGTSRVSSLPEKYRRTYPSVKYYNGGDTGEGGTVPRNQWHTVRPDGNRYYPYNNETYWFGPELGMAEVLQNKDGEIAFIKYAYGGTGIYQHPGLNNKPASMGLNRDNWHGPWDGVQGRWDDPDLQNAANPMGKLYCQLLDTVEEASAKLRGDGYAPVIRGFAWMQGETDGEIQFNGGNGDHRAADVYEHNLTEFFNAVRAELGAPELPIVFGEIYEYSASVVEVRKIVAAQRAVGNLPDNYLVETGDLVIDGSIDTWHWNGLSEWVLGIRFGEELYKAARDINNAYDDGYTE
ncbi:MAG: sialate O-acetylesterase [Clostridiales bacterium]|jgi:iduronate 2-sulfatase|nr:sialate O-acetylesterase [Clostridiales bacterium]